MGRKSNNTGAKGPLTPTLSPQERGEGEKERASLKGGERVAKVIARAGLASRREAEEWIAAGRVAVNGAVIPSPALNITAADAITVDGKRLPARERTRLFLYHKPRGLVTTTADPDGRPTIFGALPKNLPRLVSVGRLDLNTEGLLLLTNDGGLARLLELPETGWLRRYRVRAHGRVTQDTLDGLRHGIEVDGIRYSPIEAKLEREQGSNVWLTFAMREGKNREIRNVLGALGLQVTRLIRVSFGPFQLGELAEAAVDEVKTRTLREQIGERLAARAGVDFNAPLIERAGDETPRREPDRRERNPREDRAATGQGDKRFKPRHEGRDEPRRRDDTQRKRRPPPDRAKTGPRSGHVWRDRDAPRHAASAKAVQKRKHDAASDRLAADTQAPRVKRAGLLTDRKGRRVLVERIKSEQPEPPAGPPRGGGRPRGGQRPRR